jgi:O-acetyl-ADP-ribose deacetylase (regulator of RNase III)
MATGAATFRRGKFVFQVVLQPIETARADVLANCSNTSLSGSHNKLHWAFAGRRNVDTAIQRAAGPGLLRELSSFPVDAHTGQRCAPGDAVLTHSFGLALQCHWICHSVAPWVGGHVSSPSSQQLLTSCYSRYTNALYDTSQTKPMRHTQTYTHSLTHTFTQTHTHTHIYIYIYIYTPQTHTNMLNHTQNPLRAVRRVLQLSYSVGARSVAFPALGCGVAGHSGSQSIAALLDTLRLSWDTRGRGRWPSEHKGIESGAKSPSLLQHQPAGTTRTATSTSTSTANSTSKSESTVFGLCTVSPVSPVSTVEHVQLCVIEPALFEKAISVAREHTLCWGLVEEGLQVTND